MFFSNMMFNWMHDADNNRCRRKHLNAYAESSKKMKGLCSVIQVDRILCCANIVCIKRNILHSGMVGTRDFICHS